MNDFLLNLFTSSDNFRPAMMFPNVYNGNVYATDSYALIMIPERELALKYSTNDKFPSAHKLFEDFEKKEFKSIWINTNALAYELVKARIEVDKDSIKCKECKGSGDVEFEYCDTKNETHYIDADCPICGGDGCSEIDSKFARIKLDMIQNEDGTQVGIYIDDLYFHPFQLYRLFMAAIIKRIDDFEIMYDPNSYGQVVASFGNIKVLIMPMQRSS